MPRFVVLIHDFPQLHWDFMLEKEAVLRTWRLDRPPNDRGPIVAQPLPDHRLTYLDYEGPISGKRGKVTRFDQGTYSIVRDDEGALAVALAGSILRGTASVNRFGTDDLRFEYSPDFE